MVRISFAPVLSATRSRDSCWITSISCMSAGSRGVRADARTPTEPGGTNPEENLRLQFLESPYGNCLLGLLEDLDDAPALGRGQRPGLHQENAVTDTRSVLLVVRLELVGTADDLAVQRVLHTVLNG